MNTEYLFDCVIEHKQSGLLYAAYFTATGSQETRARRRLLEGFYQQSFFAREVVCVDQRSVSIAGQFRFDDSGVTMPTFVFQCQLVRKTTNVVTERTLREFGATRAEARYNLIQRCLNNGWWVRIICSVER